MGGAKVTWWAAWSERRRWRRELRNVPPRQLRSMVDSSAFYQTPGKQRWAERWVWRREHRLQLATLAIGVLGLIATYLILLFKK